MHTLALLSKSDYRTIQKNYITQTLHVWDQSNYLWTLPVSSVILL